MELFPILVSLLALTFSWVEAELTISEIKLSWLTNTSMRIKLLENTPDTILLTPTSNIPGMDTPCLFTGKLEGDPRSLVAVSGCMDSNETSLSISSMLLQGGFVDVFLVDGETYSIKYDSETSFIGIEDDVVNIPSRQKRQIPKGSDDDVVNPPPDPYPVAASFSGPLPERVTTKTDILYDNSLLGHFKGSHRETKQWISAVVELTKPYLRSLDIPITLQVGYIGHANGNIKATKEIIYSLRRLNQNILTSLTSFFCKDTSTDKSPIGIAFKGAACRKNGYALNINELHSTSNTQLRTAKVFAHELGHTFGMLHDHARLHGGDNGPCDGKGLMSYGDVPAKWSKCSNGDFKQWWRDEGYVCVKADEKNKDQTPPSTPATAGISQEKGLIGTWPAWSGYCVDSQGRAPSRESTIAGQKDSLASCLSTCKTRYPWATGCEFHTSGWCQIHTKPVSGGNGTDDTTCNVFELRFVNAGSGEAAFDEGEQRQRGEWPVSRGYCLDPQGRDQNDGTIRVGEKFSSHASCLSICKRVPKATGCEFHESGSCTVHTKPVSEGNANHLGKILTRHTCNVFENEW